MTPSETNDGSIKATIILLAYNQQDKIERAIKSLINQKCRYRYEILVADDDSADSTRAIAEDYARRYPDLIRLMKKSPNKGLVDNYFDAVLEARGEYIGDCAGDDEWLTADRLERQIEALDEDCNLSVVSSNSEYYTPATGEHIMKSGSLFKGPYRDLAVKISGREVIEADLDHDDELPYLLSSALYRRTPIRNLLTDQPELLRCYDGGVEDVPLIAALGATGDLLHLPMTGYRYYIDGESISNNLNVEKEYRFLMRVMGMVKRLSVHYGLPQKRLQSYFNRKLNYLASIIRLSGNKNLRQTFQQEVKQGGYKLPFKAKCHLLISRIWGNRKETGFH